MNLDPRLVVGGAVALTVILWAIAIVLQRVDARVTVRGFRNGSIVAVILFLIATTIVTLYFNGRLGPSGNVDLPGALALGALAGLIVGGGYLWLGALLIAIGLMFRSKPAWTTAGAWAAVPVVVVSLGFGYVSYRSVSDEGNRPPTYAGTAVLELSGEKLGSISVLGKASCQYDGTGALRFQAGNAVESGPIATTDGRPVFIRFDLDASAVEPAIQVVVGGAEADSGKAGQPRSDSIAVAPGSSTRFGSATLADIVPLNEDGNPDATERWSGQFRWSCDIPA